MSEREIEVVTAGQTIARRIEEVRKRVRGWSQQDLADAVADIGGARGSLTRTALAKIEAGGTRAANLSVEHLLVIAAALGVAPVDLFIPIDEDLPDRPSPRLKITPGNDARPAVTVTADHARAWVTGVGGPPAGGDLLFLLSQRPKPVQKQMTEQSAAAGAALVESGLLAEAGAPFDPSTVDKREVTRKPRRRGRVRKSTGGNP